MKKLLLLPFFVLSLWAHGQYDPSKATVTNKPLGVAQGVPTDARSYYYSPSLFIWRPYQSTAEVLSSLNIAKFRMGNFPIYVNVGGTLNSNGTFTGGRIKEYWFKDGTTDADLVEKFSAAAGETLSGTIAQLRALTTGTGKVYTSTDRGGGSWVDEGLNDGVQSDDGAIYIVTSNGHRLHRQILDAVKVKWFGAVGDGVTDDRVAVQNAINYCEAHSIKLLDFDMGNYYLSDSVLFKRGGTALRGLGALLREESWGGLYPSVYNVNDPFKGSSIIVNTNKRGFVYDSTVVDPIKITGLQFIPKTGNRSVGTTTAIMFRGKFEGPVWPFVVEECHFRGFNYAIRFQSPIQYLIASVQINRNAFSQNDECLYFSDIPSANVTNIGQRNLSWGLTFTHNKMHDNSRLIRGMFAKDLVTIADNNGEGNIAYANGTYPEALIDIEFTNCSVEIKGNHFEGVTSAKCIKVSSQYMMANGTLQGLGGTTQNGERHKLYLKGNNFDGVSGSIIPVEAIGCYVYNEDPYKIYGSAVFMAKTLLNSPTLMMAQSAKTDGSVFKFETNGTENRTTNTNQLAWSKSLKFNGGNALFSMNTPYGVRQMTYASTVQTPVVQHYFPADWESHIKYAGATFLVNNSYKSEFLGSVAFYYSYVDAGGNAQAGTIYTRNTLNGVPNGWSFVTAYFPNPFPSNATAKSGYFGLSTGELLDKSVLIGSDFTAFATESLDPEVIPYFNPQTEYDSTGTFYKGQTIVTNTGNYTVTDGGTIGSITGVTATGSIPSDEFIIVNKPDSLIVGQRIKIGAFDWWIRNIQGNKVFISDAIVTPFTNAAISFKPPVLSSNDASKTYTVAGIRAATTTTNQIYTTTDFGGGTWLDAGLNDGTNVDNTGTVLISANNHVLKETSFTKTKEVDVRKFGLPCDGSFHSIASLLPKVTLSQVQAIDATATLSNSADWYIVSMLLKTLPIQSTIIISGAIVIDKKITIKRGAFEIKGINSAVADKFENFKAKIVQIGNGQDVFYVTDGDGTTYGYGVGQVNNVKFTNILIEGTMTATNQSGNGFSLNLSPDAISGTAVNWSFADVSVRSCLNGFKHVTGHVNDFFFDHCDFSINFNAGFVISGDSHNQANYFNFKNTSFNSNGFMVQGGSVVDYVQDTAAPNYTKGGLITTQVVALSLNGISAQVNRGYGIDLGTGSHLGVFITGYAEANQLGDLRVLGDTSHNINVIAAGMYSRDQTFVFEDESVKKRVLLGTGSDQWKALGSYITNTNLGNTGIGTIPAFPPSEKLDIASLNGLTKLRVGYASSGNGVTLGWNNNSGRSELNTTSNFPLELGVNGQRQIAIKSSGIVMGSTPVATGTAPPVNGLLIEGAVSAARATQSTDLIRKDQLDSAYDASAFAIINAAGAGDTVMTATSNTATFKRVIGGNGISISSDANSMTISAGGGTVRVLPNADYTITASDHTLILTEVAANRTIILPAASTMPNKEINLSVRATTTGRWLLSGSFVQKSTVGANPISENFVNSGLPNGLNYRLVSDGVKWYDINN